MISIETRDGVVVAELTNRDYITVRQVNKANKSARIPINDSIMARERYVWKRDGKRVTFSPSMSGRWAIYDNQ
jgi:hypothetical protein